MNLLEKSTSRLFLIVAILVVLCSAYFVSPPRAAVASSGTGVIVPLYAYPGSMWSGLIQAKEEYPSIPMVAIINPDNGPGSYQDPTILNGVRELQSAGITVVGYISTNYGAVSESSVESQANSYHQLYGLSGAFFDQMSNVNGYQSYYSSLTDYVDSDGMWLTIGNPGTGISSSFFNTVDILCIYENAYAPSISVIASRTGGYSRSVFTMMPYEVSSISSSYVSQASSYLGYMYITNGVYPSQYTSLPWYFTTLLSYLGGSSGGGSTTTTSGNGNTALTIKAVAVNGPVLSGLWTVVASTSGSVLAKGFTSLTYYAISGDRYEVSVSDYGDYHFSHWSNGATTNTITVTVTGAMTLTAYFSKTTQTPTHTLSEVGAQMVVEKVHMLQSGPASQSQAPVVGYSNPQVSIVHNSSSTQQAPILPSNPVNAFQFTVAVLVVGVLFVAGIVGFTRKHLRALFP
ncbi:MAG TPA: spherulation-specific family 4 protein [Nitrososphaerales archaeon]|nr:spherulation-specific family 4 protein [Nitrososphaerales archaeon]